MSATRFDVAGAAAPKRFFETLPREKMAHGYLFVGPAGAGKKTFARRLAQSLLCESPGTAAAAGYDGTCRSCVLFQSGDDTRHPDFFEHTGALPIGDDDASSAFHDVGGLSSRDIVRQLALQSYVGGRRVLLMGDAAFAGDPAANALLKILEEPPIAVTVVLTTSAPDSLLPTIRSRLVEIAFPPMNAEDIAGILRANGHDEAQARRAAALAGGNATRALAMLAGEDSLRETVAAWFFAGARGVATSSQWATRETLGEGLDLVKSLARDWIASGTLGVAAQPLAPDYAKAIAELRPLDRNAASRLLQKLDDVHRMSQTNVTPALAADIVRMALAPGEFTTSG